ncbi:hypothetical protein ACI2KR_27020 [Pseudomonas luteola]
MSKLDQAKREASRLFKLAKKQTLPGHSPSLSINNLSHAREHIAHINGFPNWHVYEERLFMDDVLNEQKPKRKQLAEDSLIREHADYFLQFKAFNFNAMQKQTCKEKKKETQPLIKHHLILGHGRLDHNGQLPAFLNLHKKKAWVLDHSSFPLVFAGSAGSGKSMCILSLESQLLRNNESIIHVAGKGNGQDYLNLLSRAAELGKQDDVFLLNFLESGGGGKSSHTIDFINPLVGDDKTFELLFGHDIGRVIHSLCLAVHASNGLVTLENLESFLMLKTLWQLKDDPLFESASEVIDNYMTDIGCTDKNQLSGDSNCLLKHASLSWQAKTLLDELMDNAHLFSIEPDISFEKIISKNKALSILMPVLEREPERVSRLSKIILAGITLAVEKNEQNNAPYIVLDDMAQGINETLLGHISTNLLSKARVIIGTQSLSQHAKAPLIHLCVKMASTIVLMKHEDIYLAESLLARMFHNDVNMSCIKQLAKLHPGEANVFGRDVNTDHSHALNKRDLSLLKKSSIRYVFEGLTLFYHQPEDLTYVTLSKQIL